MKQELTSTEPLLCVRQGWTGSTSFNCQNNSWFGYYCYPHFTDRDSRQKITTQSFHGHSALCGGAEIQRRTSKTPEPELWAFHELLWKGCNKAKRCMFLYFLITGSLKLVQRGDSIMNSYIPTTLFQLSHYQLRPYFKPTWEDLSYKKLWY